MATKTKVFIDAENVSVKDFEGKYKKKIKNFAKNHGLDMNNIEFRAYAVEGAPREAVWRKMCLSIIGKRKMTC